MDTACANCGDVFAEEHIFASGEGVPLCYTCWCDHVYDEQDHYEEDGPLPDHDDFGDFDHGY